MDKTKLLEAVRKGITDVHNGEISQIKRIAKDPDTFIKKVESISDEHLATLDELEKWTDEKFAEKWDEYIIASGAGAYNFLAEILAIDKEKK